MPGYDNAINVVDWATRLSYSADTQEIGWMKSIVLGIRGRTNPFHGLIGGLNGMKPVTEVMDFRALDGNQIVATLDRPLGGQGTQGPASQKRVVGREENPKHATYRATVGVFAHMVAGEQIVKTQTVIGSNWDNRNRKKLTEYFSNKQADDIQFEMIKRGHARNTIFPNNKTSIDDLTTLDYLNLATVTDTQEILNANQAGPFDITRSSSGDEILAYLIMGSHKAWKGVSSSNAYQNLLSNADARGRDNKLFKGGLPDYFGMRLFKWSVEDGTQIGPLAAPCSPIAYLGVALPATTTTDLSATYVEGGGNAANAADGVDGNRPLFFQYYRNAQYIGHEGEKIAADVATRRYLAIRIITGADAGKIALFSYLVNNGNKILISERLGAAISGSIVTTLTGSTIVYNTDGSAPWSSIAGANGFKGVSTGIIPEGSPIYEVNSKGVPFVYSFGLGRNAILSGWGSLAPLGTGGGGSGGGTPGQRLLQEQDAGRLYSLGWQQVWGCRATEDANNMVNGYALIVSAYQPQGWPDVTA